MSHPDPSQDYGDEHARYWQEVGQWNLSIPALVRMAYEGDPEGAGSLAKHNGVYLEFTDHMSKVHARLIRQYRGQPSMPRSLPCQ